MDRTLRPFDEKPAKECLICGIAICDGAYCLHCVPPSAKEGEKAWVRQRWFSGRRAELRKRRIALQESMHRVAMLGAAGLFLFVASFQFRTASLQRVASEKRKPVLTQKHLGNRHLKALVVNIS